MTTFPKIKKTVNPYDILEEMYRAHQPRIQPAFTHDVMGDCPEFIVIDRTARGEAGDFPLWKAYILAKEYAVENAEQCDGCGLWFPPDHVAGDTCKCNHCATDGAFDNPVDGVETPEEVRPEPLEVKE